MKKILLILFVTLFIFTGVNEVKASEQYQDTIGHIVNSEQEEGKINVYLFFGDGCPHCKAEKEFLDEFISEYPDLINIYTYEVWYNQDNMNMLYKVGEYMNVEPKNVPFTVIGDNVFQGFSDVTKDQIEKTLLGYLNYKVDVDTYNLPIIGKVDGTNVSLSIVAIILGLIDGFNPCAMWVLLFLINLLIKTNNRKKMMLLGSVFLLTSALVYFLSMLGINLILSFTAITQIRRLIAIVALIAGIININTYRKTKNDEGCHVIDDNKRKKYFKRIRGFLNEKNVVLAIVGIITLAVSVNLVELACSLGFPTVFAEILAINNVTGIIRILYILLYVVCYILDDFIIFTIAVVTFELTGISNKYSKYSNLIGGAIMIILGLLLFFRPEWIMFNF